MKLCLAKWSPFFLDLIMSKIYSPSLVTENLTLFSFKREEFCSFRNYISESGKYRKEKMPLIHREILFVFLNNLNIFLYQI
jgi:hypothetical protein